MYIFVGRQDQALGGWKDQAWEGWKDQTHWKGGKTTGAKNNLFLVLLETAKLKVLTFGKCVADELCKIDLSKTKLEVSFNRNDGIVSYNPEYETYKHERYYIHIKEDDEIWKLILSRIQNLIVG